MRIIIVTFFILILGLLDLLNPIRAGFQSFTAPIQFGLRRTALEIKDASKLFYSINTIRKDNLNLLKENQELRGIVVDLKKAEEENIILRNQLKLKNNEIFQRNLLLASVMGNPSDLTGTSLILDKGTRQGVSTGDNVVLGNFIIGVIEETTEQRSVVKLVTSPDISMTVQNVESSSKAEGIASGNLGTSVVVTRLLPGEKVEQNNVFITSGKDGKFLPGLSVGIVSEVSFESAEPLKTAILEPMINFSKLEKVFIVLNQ